MNIDQNRKLVIYDYRKYQKINKEYMKNVETTGEVKKVQGGIEQKFSSEQDPWMEYSEFMNDDRLKVIFDKTDQEETEFVQRVLTMYKPRYNTDQLGWIYLFTRQDDLQKHKDGKISHVILFKIGRTKHEPKSRVKHQSNANGEKYDILFTSQSKYHCYMEYSIHRLFQNYRVVRPELKDGKTEWFMAPLDKLTKGIDKIKQAMFYLFEDTHAWSPPKPVKK